MHDTHCVRKIEKLFEHGYSGTYVSSAEWLLVLDFLKRESWKFWGQ